MTAYGKKRYILMALPFSRLWAESAASFNGEALLQRKILPVDGKVYFFQYHLCIWAYVSSPTIQKVCLITQVLCMLRSHILLGQRWK